MASTKTIVTTAFRWAAWPLGIVIALNIQNRATEAGYSRISLRGLLRSEDMTELYSAFTSDWVWGGALFLAGAVTFSWLHHWLEKSEGKQGPWARTSLAANCEGVAKMLENPGLGRFLMNPGRQIQNLNKGLVNFGFEPIADFDPKDEGRNKRSARYLRAIHGPIKSGNLEHAREIGEAVLSLEKTKAIHRTG
jgi:hypothetical protein